MKYPCIIASKGRATTSSTIPRLIAEIKEGQKADVKIVVEPQDYDAYAKVIMAKRLFCLEKDNQGIAYARNFCMELARREKAPWFWMLDDDIKEMYRVEKRKCVKAPFVEVLGQAEKELTGLPNLAVGSLEYQQYAWSAQKQFARNSYCDVAVLINTDLARRMSYRDGLKEDRDFVLQALQLGYDSARTSWLAFGAPKNGSNKGGLHDAYAAGLENHWSEKMVKTWPGICEHKAKKDGRPDVKIHWRKMRPTT